MRDYYFTFGQKYAQEVHPYYAQAHPNGWVRITAPSYAAAREHAAEVFGKGEDGCALFAFSYQEGEFHKKYFPGGEIEHMIVEDT